MFMMTTTMTKLIAVAGAGCATAVINGTNHAFSVLATGTAIDGATTVNLLGFAGLIIVGAVVAMKFQRLTDAVERQGVDIDKQEKRIETIEKNGCGLRWQHGDKK